MAHIVDVYGRYSLGSGAVLKNPDTVWSTVADPDVLASYEKSMRQDLMKSGIAVDWLRDWHIMDVGTGRHDTAKARGLLSPEREVDQLNPGLYDGAEILGTIDLYRKVRARLASPAVPRSATIAVALRIFQFLASKTRAAGYDAAQRHPDLQLLLENIERLLADEYPGGS